MYDSTQYRVTMLDMAGTKEIYGLLKHASDVSTKQINNLFECVQELIDQISEFLNDVNQFNHGVNSINEEDLELFCNADFWNAYKQFKKQENLESGTIDNLKKEIGL